MKYLFFKSKKNIAEDKAYSDDYYTNRYALSFIRYLFIAVLVVWILNYFDIFIIDSALMNDALITAIVACVLSHVIAIFVKFERPSAKYIYLFMMVLLITIVSIFMTYHAILPLLFPVIFALQYRRRIVTAYAYILTVIGIVISVSVGYMVGLCDANMLLLTTTTVREQIQLFTESPLVFNENIPLLILFYASPRAIVIAFVIPLLNHIAKTISNKALMEAESRRRADTDGLTGLLNKNAFLSTAESRYKSADSAPGAFIFVDMDHFKEVNDNLGHKVGDKAISDVADVLKKVFRQGDIIGRFGGDEFVIFLEKMPENILKDRLDELLEKLRLSYSVNGKKVDISASIGAVYYEKQPIISFSRIMDMADQQVYVVKESGRNRVSINKVRAVREDAE